jgi:hypothetical protein
LSKGKRTSFGAPNGKKNFLWKPREKKVPLGHSPSIE